MVVSSKALHNHNRGENVTQQRSSRHRAQSRTASGCTDRFDTRPERGDPVQLHNAICCPSFGYGVMLMGKILGIFALTAPLMAEEFLSLRQAVDLALRSNPQVAAASAGEKEAEARIHQARSGYLPRVQLSESFQRSNNPVFVFTSL